MFKPNFTLQTVSKIRRNLSACSDDTDSALHLRSISTLAPQDSSRDEVGGPGQAHKANTSGWAGYANSINLQKTGERPRERMDAACLHMGGWTWIRASNKERRRRTRSCFSNIHFLPKQTRGWCHSEQTAEVDESPSAQVFLRLSFVGVACVGQSADCRNAPGHSLVQIQSLLPGSKD